MCLFNNGRMLPENSYKKKESFWVYLPGDFSLRYKYNPNNIKDNKMKSTIISDVTTNKVGYDKAQIVTDIKKEKVILTDGKHTTNLFSGTLISTKEDTYPLGTYKSDWFKSSFYPVDSITIKFDS